MPEHLHYNDDDLFNPETSHEESDINVRAVIWFAVIFVIFAIVTHLVIYFMYGTFVKLERKAGGPALSAIPRAADASVPKNQPLLQPFPMKDAKGNEIAPTANTPVTDLIEMRRNEDLALNNYGWISKEHGTVRLPIEVAKQITAARMAVAGQTGAMVTPAGVAPAGADSAMLSTGVSPATNPAQTSTNPQAPTAPVTPAAPATPPHNSTLQNAAPHGTPPQGNVH